MRIAILFGLVLLGFVVACAEEGSEGSGVGQCGDFGEYHAGHCHCETGYLYDGDACVLPQAISLVCEEHQEPGDGSGDTVSGDSLDAQVTGGADSVEEEHEHGAACLCPAQGECPCEHGTVEVFAGLPLCVPELD